MARVLKFFAITQDGKTADADIHTDGGAAYQQRLRLRHFTFSLDGCSIHSR